MYRFTLSLILISLATISCGKGPNALWGSIDQSYPLDFDQVDILKQDTALRIEYLKDIHGFDEKVVQIVVMTADVQIENNSTLKNDAFQSEIVTLHRVESVGDDFPPLSSGEIHFDKFNFAVGGRVSGDFSVVFQNGRNLFGNFDQKVEEVPVD